MSSEIHLNHCWTAVDLAERLGPIPLDRVGHDPPPGCATEEDVLRHYERDKRMFELVEGILVEKTVGTYESFLAATIVRILGQYVTDHDLGIVLGADGMLRLAPGLVRIPDVSFIAWDRIPGRRIPEQAIADLCPSLAVEVLSRSNTRQEMDLKLREYFACGSRSVWMVDPAPEEIRVYVNPERCQVFSRPASLTDLPLLSGFELPLDQLFVFRDSKD
jgi:Uma2 family endonuclease